MVKGDDDQGTPSKPLSPRRSVTPERSRGRSPPAWGRRTGRQVIIERIVDRSTPAGNFPILTKSNYHDWAALMRVMLQARGLWTAVSDGTSDYTEDRMALEVLTKVVPPEMMGTIATKASAKIAWESLQLQNVGAERVRKARVSTLQREFDALKFKDGESVDDFGTRITKLATEVAGLGKPYSEEDIVRKFLQVVPPKFDQIAASIETLLELSEVTVDELIGRLKAMERVGVRGDSAIARLNLTEDELLAKLSSRLKMTAPGGSKEASSGGERGRGYGRGCGRGRGGGRDGNGRSRGGAGGDDKTVAHDECRYCGKKGHWARECRKKKDEQVHSSQVEEAETFLMVAKATTEDIDVIGKLLAEATASSTNVRLDDNKLFVQLDKQGEHKTTRWILDTGATNHMTSERAAFSELDTRVHGSMRFGDGSTASIEGRGSVLFKLEDGGHKVLAGVYHIPSLTASIVSIGQLDEAGFKVVIHSGVCKIWDARGTLLATVQRTKDRLYLLNLDIGKPICLASQGSSAAWRWHARFVHLNFRGL
ncbi:hypothetical protein GUJ93_ZPchr0014g46611 [Zizania palustris]|uniref:CCHC-type domain-containing protein n=1 Tax=Zizania palustris TaxID=103762 RepID=A0A8J5W0R4_ZIZPA|nr:hypothetical protein GUJ93_ZPchr0014g46611 [Zizania palustris]